MKVNWFYFLAFRYDIVTILLHRLCWDDVLCPYLFVFQNKISCLLWPNKIYWFFFCLWIFCWANDIFNNFFDLFLQKFTFLAWLTNKLYKRNIFFWFSIFQSKTNLFINILNLNNLFLRIQILHSDLPLTFKYLSFCNEHFIFIKQEVSIQYFKAIPNLKIQRQ